MFAVPTDNAGRTRLLSASIPARFFVAAAVFDLLAWLLLSDPDFAAGAGRVFAGGFGSGLAGLHALTLGCLAMTITGASLQLLPVATVQSVRSPGLPRLTWWLLVVGASTLVTGFATGTSGVAFAGAIAAGTGLGVHAWMLGAHLAAARRQRAMTWHAWAALACLCGVIASGPLLVLQHRLGMLPDPQGVALAHLLLSVCGYAGLLVTGFAYLLLPMFMVAKGASETRQRALLGVFLLALVVALVLLTAGLPRRWLAAPALLGLAAFAVHAWTMNGVLKRRRSTESPWTRVLVRAAWLAAIAGFALGALLAAGIAPPRLGMLFVVLLVPGWLLSFLLGILLRILPFLASVHVRLRGGRQPGITALASAPLAWLVAGPHLAAVLLLAAGQGVASPALVRAGAASGVLSALSLLAFQAAVVLRSRRELRQPQ